jgi:hypothetical protein
VNWPTNVFAASVPNAAKSPVTLPPSFIADCARPAHSLLNAWEKPDAACCPTAAIWW